MAFRINRAALGAAILFTTATIAFVPALANPFAGAYVGADAGYEDSGRIDKGGATFGGFAGFNLALGDRMIAGVEARVGDSDIKETLSRTASGFTTVTRNSVGRHYGAAARLGYVAGEGTLLYGRVGWENVRLNSVATRTPVPPTTNPNPVITDASFDDDTLVLGVGLEQRIVGKTALRLSYDYGEQFDRHQLRAGVVFGF